jgi:hypothetical protein
MRVSRFAISLSSLFWLCWTSSAHGIVSGLIEDRVALEAILAEDAKTEDFESISLPPNGLLQLGPALNSETIHNGNGPGLVIPGVTFLTQTDTQIYSPAFLEATHRDWASLPEVRLL